MTLADVDLTDLDTFVRGVPHDQFDAPAREAPVYFHPEPDGGRGFWCITRYDDLARSATTGRRSLERVGHHAPRGPRPRSSSSSSG